MDSMDHGGIKWGAEIAVDGVRPEWLISDDVRVLKKHGGGTYVDGQWQELPVLAIGWHLCSAIRLPADHPHYQKQAAQAVTKVDWLKPIEAVHVDGRVVAVEVASNLYGTGFYDISPELPGGNFSFNADGTHKAAKWTIRNVQPPEAAPAIDPALVERMVKHLRDFADWDATTDSWYVLFKQWQAGARDILKALEPVDEDEEEAKRAVAEDKWANAYDLALAAIRRGRQLERERAQAEALS